MLKIVSYIHKISDITNHIISLLTALTAACFAVLIFSAVLSRYVFHYPILYSVEISRLMFIWSCFLAATIAYKRNAHIRFEFTRNILGETGTRITNLAAHLACLVFFIGILIASIDYTIKLWPTSFPIIGISQGWIYTSLIVSMSILLIHSISHLIKWFGGDDI